MERARLINPLAVAGVAFKATSDKDVNLLISEIREALKKSKASGGSYGVYRKQAGQTVLAIDVQVTALRAKK